ncbi:MAG: DUF5665 domain-containing protein, partial [Primorskyibacter sp.]
MTDPSLPQASAQPHEPTERLTTALETLAAHRFVRIHDSTLSLIWFQFLRGVAFGFGTVVGASIVVSAVVLVLSQIELI